MRRRTLLAAASALSLPALAQEAWPNRPLRLIYPYAAGGTTDLLARAVADRLKEELGQPVVVENRPGGNTTLAAQFVAKQAPADGHTILWAALPALTTGFHFFKDVGYRLEDLQPVTMIVRAPNAFATRADAATDLATFVARSKASPAPLAYATNGIGGSSHLVAEMFQQAAGIKLEVVPYRGESQAVTDILGGRIPAYCGSVGSVLEYHRADTMRILAVSSPVRLPNLPDVPTFREGGVDLVYTWWHGICVRTGTPRPIVDRLNAAFASALAHPSIAATLSPGSEAAPMSPEAFGEVIQRDHARLGGIIRDRNIRVEG